MTKEDHETIWLEPAGAADRCWCQTNEWGDEGVEYVRRDIAAAEQAEPATDARSGAVKAILELVQYHVTDDDDRASLTTAISALEPAEPAPAAVMAALTPSAETKALHMGEYQFEFGDYTPTVPWITIKQIMAAIRKDAEQPWRPISTAPNGEHILFFPEVKNPRGSGLPAMVRIDHYPVSYPRKPTLWMPVPDLPKETK